MPHLLALMRLKIWDEPHLEDLDAAVVVDRLAPAARATIATLTSRDSYRSAQTRKLISVQELHGLNPTSENSLLLRDIESR